MAKIHCKRRTITEEYTMNRVILAVFVLATLAVVSSAPKTLEENIKLLKAIDINTVLNNHRIIESYVYCVIGRRPCTKEGKALKDSWKDGIDKGCDDCSEEEKRKVKKIVKHMYKNEPELYKLLSESLDKDGKYKEKYDKYIKEIVDDDTL
ncbi:unnamed protein product [Psylliodes chrysocephalus]|uniref:Uncharacterized protein n=1 Tax=Psylliodes chrysocephalus TaxID=3402493 RepID=A0A9P0GBT7_9CUCU|nr:unnamed protein product [Psylliodes chrysocephala]